MRSFRKLSVQQKLTAELKDEEDIYRRQTFVDLPSHRCEARRQIQRRIDAQKEATKESSDTSMSRQAKRRKLNPTTRTLRSNTFSSSSSSTNEIESCSDETEEDDCEIEIDVYNEYIEEEGWIGNAGDFFFTTIAEDHILLQFEYVKVIINTIGNTGYQKGAHRDRVEIQYAPVKGESLILSEKENKLLLKNRLARKLAKLIGIRCCCDAVHQIRKPDWLYAYQKLKSAKQKVSRYTYFPARYKCHDTFKVELDELLNANPSFEYMLQVLNDKVKECYPELHAWILDIIPEDFRLFPKMIWTQCGMVSYLFSRLF